MHTHKVKKTKQIHLHVWATYTISNEHCAYEILNKYLYVKVLTYINENGNKHFYLHAYTHTYGRIFLCMKQHKRVLQQKKSHTNKITYKTNIHKNKAKLRSGESDTFLLMKSQHPRPSGMSLCSCML